LWLEALRTPELYQTPSPGGGPIAVGDRLPDMSIFLTPDRYVPCPLEDTYMTTWGVFPAALKGELERPAG
jgi:hypothetical protein